MTVKRIARTPVQRAVQRRGLVEKLRMGVDNLERLFTAVSAVALGEPFFPTTGKIVHDGNITLSILKTIEQRFGLDPLSALDANATPLTNSLR